MDGWDTCGWRLLVEVKKVLTMKVEAVVVAMVVEMFEEVVAMLVVMLGWCGGGGWC